MAINFPTTSGQATDGSFKHTEVGKQWSWDGTSWNIEISDSANTLNPSPSDVTFNYYNGQNINASSAGDTSRVVTGTGTQADPFILGTILVDGTAGQTNLTGSTTEEIVIQGSAGQPVEFIAINDTDNQFDQPLGVVDTNGQWRGRLFYNGYIHQNSHPTENTEYTIDIRLGSTSVYFRWVVYHITSYIGTDREQIFSEPGEIVVKFSNFVSTPCLYSCANNSVTGPYYDSGQYTYSRGASGYRFTNAGVITTRYKCGHPHTNNCSDVGRYKTLWKLEFMQMPFQYEPASWFTNNDSPTHTVNVPTINNAFTGTFDSGRATSTGGTMSWNPEGGIPEGGLQFKYSVELYDDNANTESRAKIDGTWGSWVSHAANGWATIGSAPVAGTTSIISNIETRGTDYIQGQQVYTSPGTYSWTCPANITSVCVVCVGTGGPSQPGAGGVGGGGGGLGWKNNISVTPGQSYTVVVGAHGTSTYNDQTSATAAGDSYFIDTSTVKGGGGGVSISQSVAAPGGTYTGDGGGNGGDGGASPGNNAGGGGGGAGGYSGAGGAGGSDAVGSAGSGGAGGGGGSAGQANNASGGGGGVGLLGEGASGSGGAKDNSSTAGGGGGSGGTGGTSITWPGSFSSGPGNHNTDECGGEYGGGAGAQGDAGQGHLGGSGAVRIIWGSGRAFPSTNTQDVSGNAVTLPGFYAVKIDANASSSYGASGAILENKDQSSSSYLNGYLPYSDEGTWYNVSEWGHWQGSKCIQSGWWGVAFYTCSNEYHWVSLDEVTYTAFTNTNTVNIGNVTPYPLGYDLINGVKTVYASQNPILFNFTNDGYADPNFFTYVWSTTDSGVTFDDATKREPEVTFDANDLGLKTLKLTISSNESGVIDSPATGEVEVNVLASYSNETIGNVTITAGFWDSEDVEDSTDILERWRADVTYDGSTSLATYQWAVTDLAGMPAAPVISAPTGDQTFITFRYDPTNNAHMGNRTITCTVTATDATDSPVSDTETIYMPN